ncbi:MAG: serine/threonine protein kinase, partial [Burkholderiaceae bacterium]|nr:serine/threonine protein kinase [Burkholderiaceae bacterium]
MAAALDALETDGPDAVERLLTAHPNEASRVRRALEDLRRMELLETPEPGMPEQLGDFTILEQLGAGGMGVVYRARQRSLDREVALKVVRPELLLFEGARERFRREIDAVARLDHASIVPILATGSAQGVPFYAMPLLHGRNGEELVEALAGRAPASLAGEDLRRALGPSLEEVDDEDAFAGSWWQTCVRLVRKAALGIHHAHTRGVLHRDLKPSNVLFTPTGNAVVIDFGLARAPADLQMTRTGTTAGSPVYMSPEQVRSEPCDERTDVYGLAATLHCLLSLAPPFSTGEPNALFDRILAGACTDLGRRDAAPVELRAVLACGMDIDRLHRYPSALAFADDLAAVLAGRPISARQLPAPVRLRRFVRRHPTGTAALGVAAASLVVLLAVLFWQQRAANRDIAAEVREKERINAALSESNRVLQEQIARADRSVSISIDAVEGLLSNVVRDRLRNLPGTLRMGAEMMHQALALFDRLPADAEHSPRVARARIQTL